MKFCLISKKYGIQKRGAFVTGERLKRRYPSQIESLHIDQIYKIDDLRSKYRRLIFTTQTPTGYSGRYNFVVQRPEDIVYFRTKFEPKCYNNVANNGFNYYIDNPSVDFFLPRITPPNTWCKNFEGTVYLGAYIRPGISPESLSHLRHFLKEFKYKIYLMTMGWQLDFRNIPNVVSQEYTTDNYKFFRNITHYIHIRSRSHVDTFPNTLLEAVNSGAQIIIPDLTRNFRDGIDDICSCIYYHKTLDIYKLHDNKNTPLTANNFDNFYRNLFKNNFEYSFDRKKYKTLREWCEGEL